MTLPYAPRSRLHVAIHEALDTHRFGVAVCHRRFGKTILAVNHLVKGALTCERTRPRFAYIAPTYKQGKAIAWDYLKHYTNPIPGRTANEVELRVDFPNGGQVRIYGADDPDALRGIYLDGAVCDEFGLMKGRTWSQVVRPALTDRMGWALFIGTPNGRNAFYELTQFARAERNWFLAIHKASETALISRAELADAAGTMTNDEYEQEFECSFEAAVRGAIYRDELRAARESGRIGRVPHDPMLPVDTFWDIGGAGDGGDATSIWCRQRVGPELRYIAYHEARGKDLAYYARWLREQPFSYRRHLLPHDAKAKWLGTGKSVQELAEALLPGGKVTADGGVRVGVASSVTDRINATRLVFPRCYFDADGCEDGLLALQHYHREYVDKLGQDRPMPVHDWASHGADAFGYSAQDLEDAARVDAPREAEYVRWSTDQSGAWMA